MTTIGMVSRADAGERRQLLRAAGQGVGPLRSAGVGQEEAGPFKLGTSAKVSTWDELVAALQNGYPVTICTAQGFTLERDAQGFCKARGRWGHCMFIAGVRFDRPGACIIQSWGPGYAQRPDRPSASRASRFWADQPVMERDPRRGR